MYHPLNPKTIERISAAQHSPRPTLRQELNAAYTAQMVKARAVRGSRNPKDVAMGKRAEASMAELAEQLLLLDAVEFGFIKPIIGGTMEFDALLKAQEGQS